MHPVAVPCSLQIEGRRPNKQYQRSWSRQVIRLKLLRLHEATRTAIVRQRERERMVLKMLDGSLEMWGQLFRTYSITRLLG